MLQEIKRLQFIENQRTINAVGVELDWWGKSLIDDPGKAVSEGSLVVVPDEGEGYRLIYKLRSGEEPKLLNHKAFKLLKDISFAWRGYLSDMGVKSDELFLSVTSLYRPQSMQDEFVNKGMNAAVVSAHRAGAVIDFDPEGYYFGAKRQPLNRLAGGADAGVMDMLLYCLVQMDEKGVCHLVAERRYETLAGAPRARLNCYHVCVSPEY